MEVVSTTHELVACAKALPRNFANLEPYAEELKMMELHNMNLEKELLFRKLLKEFVRIHRVEALHQSYSFPQSRC